MSLLELVAIVIVIGVAVYLVETYIPLTPPIRVVLRVLIVVLCVWWLLQLIGITGPTIGRIR